MRCTPVRNFPAVFVTILYFIGSCALSTLSLEIGRRWLGLLVLLTASPVSSSRFTSDFFKLLAVLLLFSSIDFLTKRELTGMEDSLERSFVVLISAFGLTDLPLVDPEEYKIISECDYRGSPTNTVSTSTISTSTNFIAIGIKLVLVEFLELAM